MRHIHPVAQAINSVLLTLKKSVDHAHEEKRPVAGQFTAKIVWQLRET